MMMAQSNASAARTRFLRQVSFFTYTKAVTWMADASHAAAIIKMRATTNEMRR
jgi:hypothetical protein